MESQGRDFFRELDAARAQDSSLYAPKKLCEKEKPGPILHRGIPRLLALAVWPRPELCGQILKSQAIKSHCEKYF